MTSLRRRCTAKNALIALLLWLVLALFLHLRSEVWSPGSRGKGKGKGSGIAKEEGKADSSGNNSGGGGSISSGKIRKRKTAVVVASQKSEDTGWLDEYFPEWEKNVYKVDMGQGEVEGVGLRVPRNKGRESMVYLTYIIDHYDNLPDNILFIHPTRYQWHNDDPDYDGLPMLRHFQLPYLEKEGYVNIRCAWSLGCPAEIKPLVEAGEHREAVHAGGDYKKAFEQLFPGTQVPKFVGVSCCAQFAATREKVRERKREEYMKWREWLVETELNDSISGRVFEYSWHMIFGKEPVHCPSVQECYCNVFGLCNLDCKEQGSCPGRYTLPPYSSLPNGWPFVGWDGQPRNRSGPET